MCPSLCNPMDCSPPGSSVHGILQARILEWAAISFTRGSSWPKDRTQVCYTAGRFFTIWAFREFYLEKLNAEGNTNHKPSIWAPSHKSSRGSIGSIYLHRHQWPFHEASSGCMTTQMMGRKDTCVWFFCSFFKTEVYFIHSFVLISAIQQSD